MWCGCEREPMAGLSRVGVGGAGGTRALICSRARALAQFAPCALEPSRAEASTRVAGAASLLYCHLCNVTWTISTDMSRMSYNVTTHHIYEPSRCLKQLCLSGWRCDLICNGCCYRWAGLRIFSS